MNTYRNSLLSVFLLIVSFILLYPTPAMAQYEPPNNVTLTMYRLIEPGGEKTDDVCTRDNDDIATAYGCTAIKDSNVYSYPFASSEITLSIDGSAIINPDNDDDLVEDNSYSVSQRYLWDVAAQEIGLTGSNGVKPLAGVEAQAIASRTYTYQRILEGYTIDNSANLHVFLPYKFETLGQAEKNRLIEAMQHRYYMTPATDNPNTAENEAIYPILAQYGADNRERTTQGTLEGKTIGAMPNYLSAIEDPINALYGCSSITIDDDGEAHIDYLTNDDTRCGTGNGGMSSKGASRWSYGHTSSQGPVAPDDERYPHDTNRLGDFWSVRWENALQILTHYYTGVHIRDVNDNNRIVTPAYRWTPLQAAIPNLICLNQPAVWMTIWFQNTSIAAWDLGWSDKLRVSATYLGNAVTGQGEAMFYEPTSTLVDLPAGASVYLPFPYETANFTNGPGRYRIRFDMIHNGQSFSDLAGAEQPPKQWDPYDVELQVDESCTFSYVPMIQSAPAATQ